MTVFFWETCKETIAVIKLASDKGMYKFLSSVQFNVQRVRGSIPGKKWVHNISHKSRFKYILNIHLPGITGRARATVLLINNL